MLDKLTAFVLTALVVLAIYVATTTVSNAGDFRRYPGFINSQERVEMTTDKGLIVEIVLRCSRRANGQVKAGIMTYSKVERVFCSSKNRCYRSAERAARNTCS